MLKSFLRIVSYLKIIGLKGVFLSIATKLLNRTFYIEKTWGRTVNPIRLRALTSDIPTYRQVFVYGEYDLPTTASPKVIVDAGANIGLASIFFANTFADSIILAIEPEKSNFDLLKENTSRYPNIYPVQAALWKNNEMIKVVDRGLGKWGFMTESNSSQRDKIASSEHTIQGYTVDKLMRDYDIHEIDILKIDIEGAEKEVFNDTSKWLSKVDTLIVELHEDMKPGCNRSFYLGSNGFAHEWTRGENIYLSRTYSNTQNEHL